MFTVRYLLLLTLCLAVSTLWIDWERRPTLVQTGHELDLAVVGPGYFEVSHLEEDQTRFTRCGKFHVNQSGLLGVEAEGEFWALQPRITIPTESRRVLIRDDGAVQVLSHGNWQDIGQLSLCRFVGDAPFDRPLALNERDDQSGAPTTGIPSNEFGLLQQGWLERESTPLRSLAQAVCLAVLASLVLNHVLTAGKSWTRPDDSSQ